MKQMNSDPIIIFDFGNVLIDLDYPKAIASFNQLLGTEWDLQTQLPQRVISWINAFESGMIAEETFLWKFQHHYNSNLNPRDIISAWNSLLIGMPAKRFPFLLDLRKKYTTVLLSNTNSFHIQWIRNYLKKEHGVHNWEADYFDKVFYSHEVLCRKPEYNIYKHVMEQLTCRADDIIFIDDLKENILAARAIGWYGIVHKPKDSIEEKLETYISEWSENINNRG